MLATIIICQSFRLVLKINTSDVSFFINILLISITISNHRLKLCRKDQYLILNLTF